MKKMLFMFAICLVLAGAGYSQCRDIRFARGRYSTVVAGTTTRGYLCYRIRAKEGQIITLHLDSPDRKTSFSLRQDYYDADFTAESVRDWEGGLGEVNAYLISIGGGRAGSKFSLAVSIK